VFDESFRVGILVEVSIRRLEKMTPGKDHEDSYELFEKALICTKR
jgi:hypothetical protein